MLPRLIQLGDFSLPTYGLLVAAAFLAAIWLTTRLARQRGIPEESVSNLAIYCALVGMLGAKLGMFLFDWQYFAGNPREFFSLNTLQAAGVFQTGFLTAFIFAFWYMRRHRLPALRTADLFSPGVALGHALGRIGCFAAGCCYGDRCDRPWAVRFTNPDSTIPRDLLGVPLHPTQLYESFGNLALCGLLLWLIRKPLAPGRVLGAYLLSYSLLRFSIEFFRVHEQALVLGLSLTQWISAATLLLGVWLLLRPATPAKLQPATA